MSIFAFYPWVILGVCCGYPWVRVRNAHWLNSIQDTYAIWRSSGRNEVFAEKKQINLHMSKKSIIFAAEINNKSLCCEKIFFFFDACLRADGVAGLDVMW